MGGECKARLHHKAWLVGCGMPGDGLVGPQVALHGHNACAWLEDRLTDQFDYNFRG